jgi:hypothetical protein
MRTPWSGHQCAVATAVSALALLAVGCGAAGSASSTAGTSASATPSVNPLAGLTAGQIATKAQADLKAASSVHIAGPVADSGQTYQLNMTISPKGCRGTMAAARKGSFLLLVIGKKLWFKGDRQFWRTSGGSSDPSIVTLLEGKYIETSVKSADMGSFATLCDPRQLAGAFGGSASGMVKGKTTVIDGQSMLQLKDTTDASSAYVTISARPEFALIDGGSSGHLDFTAYDAPLRLSPPPAGETIDGSRYGF